MSKWTSKHAILRDLSEAQGLVPVEIEGIVSAEDKPPPLALTEETEEEFYRYYGDGDACAAPDFGLIKQMLNMVSNVNLNYDESENSESPKDPESKSPTEIPIENKKKNKRKGRNAAFESIFKMEREEIKNGVTENTVTSKINNIHTTIGHDITPYQTPSTSTTSKQVSPQKASPKIALEPFSMFKKKASAPKPVEIVEKKVSKPAFSNSTYKPSVMAEEYYKQYVERVKLNETIREDIWTKAEKQMKEIEAKKRLKQAQLTTNCDDEKIIENKSN